MESPVLLCGLGRVGRRVLEFLKATGIPVLVIDLHASPDDPQLAGVKYLCGDCRNASLLEEIGIAGVRGIIIVTSDDLVNVSVALMARRLNPECRIVVRMFNQSLIPRLGATMRNMTALSVSALPTHTKHTQHSVFGLVGVFKLDSGPHQISEITASSSGTLVGMKLSDIASRFRLLVLAHTSSSGRSEVLHTVSGDTILGPNDQFIVCGRPDDLAVLIASDEGDLPTGVLWAGRVRRFLRTLRRTLSAVDLSVKIGTLTLLSTLLVSSMIFRLGIGTTWSDGLYQTHPTHATGSDLHGDKLCWVCLVFLSVLKVAGAALLAGFTAIFTQYLVRAKLGGAFELRKIPDGGHIVVCVGCVWLFWCVEELMRMGRQVTAIEKAIDNPFAATVRNMGVAVIFGDATVPEVLRQARAQTARAVIAATSSELANLEVALLGRELNPDLRVVVRLTDPDFAEAVRAGAEIKLAYSIPALAAPAFAAALFGDRVHTLFSVAGKTLAVVELQVQPNDPCLDGISLTAAMVNHRFLPVGVSGRGSFSAQGIPRDLVLRTNDSMTVVMELRDLESLLRRIPPAADWSVQVEEFRAFNVETLILLIRAARKCSQEEAEELMKQPPFLIADGLTRGAAEELAARVTRERAVARVIPKKFS